MLGRPIAHSLSPVLHRSAYAALGLDWTYQAIDCGVDEFAAVLADRADWAGFSCTMPLKHVAVQVAAEVRPLARAVGAANTLVPGDTGWIAENTDVVGVVAALAEHHVEPSSVTVLGAGGTAQAVVAALTRMGIGRCTALVREPARTSRLLATAEVLDARVDVRRLAVDAPELGADLVVSTLPPHAADALAPARWSARQAVLDVVYDPWPTALATSATAAGATVVGGALVLLHQAVAQVELMTAQTAPVEAMRAALRAAIA